MQVGPFVSASVEIDKGKPFLVLKLKNPPNSLERIDLISRFHVLASKQSQPASYRKMQNNFGTGITGTILLGVVGPALFTGGLMTLSAGANERDIINNRYFANPASGRDGLLGANALIGGGIGLMVLGGSALVVGGILIFTRPPQ